MRRIRVERRRVRRRAVEVLPLDPRDPAIAHAKELEERRWLRARPPRRAA